MNRVPTPSKLRIVPGSRIRVRDEEWRVARVETEFDTVIHAVGISPLVRDRNFTFVAAVENDIQLVNPESTTFEPDVSADALKARLFIDAVLATTPATEETTNLLAEPDGSALVDNAAGDNLAASGSGSEKEQKSRNARFNVGFNSPQLTVGHRGALDVHDWQLRPAALALSRPRHSVLIADAVGMGKTVECGVLLSELIRRGKGDRILIVTLKSLLQQFQTELWQRFSIPFARLDSQRIQRIQAEIPTYHNPFHTYPRSIISIDTLKNSGRYRTWLERTDWDVVVIDECQHVAQRARTVGSQSLRSKLAKLLSQQTETLIMMSATPHDGKAESFASLLNMLDPTAVSDPEDYEIQDAEGLVIRRFKKDVKNHDASFKQRELRKVICPATEAESEALKALEKASFATLDNPRARAGNRLFATTLLKAFLSSPRACLDTLGNRKKRVERELERIKQELKTGKRHDGSPSRQNEDELSESIASLRKDKSKLSELIDQVARIDRPHSPVFLPGRKTIVSSPTPNLRVNQTLPEEQPNSIGISAEHLPEEQPNQEGSSPEESAQRAFRNQSAETAVSASPDGVWPPEAKPSETTPLGAQPTANSRLNAFLGILKAAGWKNKKAGERFVVFSERIATLNWLREELAGRFGLSGEELPLFTGSSTDMEQASMIEKFGQADSKVRLLLASDAASEGVNLHYNCNHLVHFDIPWSLITFEQRNGRIDRMGQKKTPFIDALVLKTDDPDVKSDIWIVDKLVDKGETVAQNLGDPRIEWQAFGFEDIADADAESDRVEEGFERSLARSTGRDGSGDGSDGKAGSSGSGTGDDGQSSVSQGSDGPASAVFDLSMFFQDDLRAQAGQSIAGTHSAANTDTSKDAATLHAVSHDDLTPDCAAPFALFPNPVRWLIHAQKALIESLDHEPFTLKRYEDAPDSAVDLVPGASLASWLKRYADLPATSDGFRIRFTTDRQRVMDSLDRALNEGSTDDRENPWQVLWEMHPAVQWIQEQLVSTYSRGTSPAVAVRDGLAEGEQAWLVLGQLSNKRGQPRISQLVSVRRASNGTFAVADARDLLEDVKFTSDTPASTPQAANTDALESALPGALSAASEYFLDIRSRRGERLRPALLDAVNDVQRWADKRVAVLTAERDAYDPSLAIHKARREAKQREIHRTERQADKMQEWIRDVMSVDQDSLHLHPVCALSKAESAASTKSSTGFSNEGPSNA